MSKEYRFFAIFRQRYRRMVGVELERPQGKTAIEKAVDVSHVIANTENTVDVPIIRFVQLLAWMWPHMRRFDRGGDRIWWKGRPIGDYVRELGVRGWTFSTALKCKQIGSTVLRSITNEIDEQG